MIRVIVNDARSAADVLAANPVRGAMFIDKRPHPTPYFVFQRRGARRWAISVAPAAAPLKNKGNVPGAAAAINIAPLTGFQKPEGLAHL